METKTCSKCGEDKQQEAYSKGRRQCKVCIAATHKQWADQHRDQLRDYSRNFRRKNADYYNELAKKRRDSGKRSIQDKLYRYGLTEVAYKKLLDDHNHQCAICGSVENLVVDHDHKSGAVRGILCRFCNAGLGCMRDNVLYTLGAAKYLVERVPDRIISALEGAATEQNKEIAA